MFVPPEGLTRIAIHAEIVEIVVALKMPVMLADPVQFVADERRDDRSRDVGVVVAAERIANVVQQRHDHIVFVPSVAMRAGGGLQRMFQPADRETAEIAFQQPQVIEHAIGQSARENPILAADYGPVLRRAFLHLAKFRAFACIAHRFSPLP